MVDHAAILSVYTSPPVEEQCGGGEKVTGYEEEEPCFRGEGDSKT